MSNANEEKLKQYQGLRAVAFLSVFFCHVTLLTKIDTWGVAVFFVLSGFLMTLRHLEDPEVTKIQGFRGCFAFTLRHVKKFYPLYLVTLLSAAAAEVIRDQEILIAGMPLSALRLLIRMVTNILLITDWIRFPFLYEFQEFNIVTWFLSALAVYWLLTPVILRFLRKLKSGKSIVLVGVIAYTVQCLVVSLLIILLGGSSWRLVYQHPLLRLGDYFSGCVCGCVAQELRKDGRKTTLRKKEWLSVGVVLCNVLSCIATFQISAAELYSNEVYFTVPICLLILVLTDDESLLTKVLFWKPLVALGDLSGNAFLIHVVVINYMHAIYKRIFNNGTEIPLILWVVLSLVTTLFLSFIWNLSSRRKNASSWENQIP